MESAPVQLDIVDRGELYDDINGDSRLHEVLNVKLEDISNVELIPTGAYCPLVSPNLTKAPENLPENCYIKKPSLKELKLSEPIVISDRVTIRETLRAHLHPNIAKYIGCQVRDGRIDGICLVKYRETLRQRVNPRGISKVAFRYADSEHPLEDREGFLSGVESGIRHLHSLGLVHNDINPANIMLDDNDNPVIIDFDSCCPIGQSLEGIGSTYPWYEEGSRKTATALPRNDLDALWDIREWLSDSSVKKYKFKEE